jgi:hypothetical protein
MSQKVTPRDMAIVVGSAILGFCIMIAALAAFNCLANVVYQQKITATDVELFDTRTDTAEVTERGRVQNADALIHTVDTEWGKMDDGESGRKSEFYLWVEGADGERTDQWKVEVSGSGYKYRWEAKQIKGEFTGMSKSVVTETGIPSVDAVTSIVGNGSFRGTIINGMTGRPVTEQDTQLIGNMSMEDWFNVSITKEVTNADWLSFCEATYKTAMLDQGGNGVYIEPYGWDVDETGKLKRDMTEWRLNKTTGVLELRT